RDGELVAVAVVGGPGQEIPHVAGARTGGEPLVDVGLAAVGERGVFRGEPGQEIGRGFDFQSGVGGVGAGR
ncbi:MAG: hypothetical protein ACRDRO_02005, partial [Pseudonocardiaceae bacterium]